MLFRLDEHSHSSINALLGRPLSSIAQLRLRFMDIEGAGHRKESDHLSIDL